MNVPRFPALVRSPTVSAFAARELSAPSREGAESSRGRRRFRDQSGQAVIEFALVVPLICLLIVAIFHFAKVMNYWLDLNHVASYGAREAAVNTFATDGEYDDYLRDRLETTELRTGGTTSIPNPATIEVCLTEGPDVGDPVTVQVAAEYSLPLIGTTIDLRGTATMRMEQPAEFPGAGACA